MERRTHLVRPYGRQTHVTTLWYSAFSLPFPAYSFVATENWVTLLPLARLRISGSRVRRPVRRTLFIGPCLLLDRPVMPARPCVVRREWRVPRNLAAGPRRPLGSDFTRAYRRP